MSSSAWATITKYHRLIDLGPGKFKIKVAADSVPDPASWPIDSQLPLAVCSHGSHGGRQRSLFS